MWKAARTVVRKEDQDFVSQELRLRCPVRQE